jgi:hypothetical protein
MLLLSPCWYLCTGGPVAFPTLTVTFMVKYFCWCCVLRCGSDMLHWLWLQVGALVWDLCSFFSCYKYWWCLWVSQGPNCRVLGLQHQLGCSSLKVWFPFSSGCRVPSCGCWHLSVPRWYEVGATLVGPDGCGATCLIKMTPWSLGCRDQAHWMDAVFTGMKTLILYISSEPLGHPEHCQLAVIFLNESLFLISRSHQ